MSYYTKKRGYAEIQGRLHEDALLSKLGGDTQNTNDLVRDNFRTHDLVSSEGVWSVKSHMGTEGQMTEWAAKSYQAEFDYMLGWNRGTGAVELDAKALRENLPKETGLPAPLKEGSLQESTDYLKNNSILGVPEDHVEAVRKNLIDHAREYPETYGLPEQPGDEEIGKLASRVQGTGLKASDTPALVNEKLQQQEHEEKIETGKSEKAQREKDEEEESGYGYGY